MEKLLSTFSILIIFISIECYSSNVPQDSLMHLYYVQNPVEREAVCNDGSGSGFYFRKGDSQRWVIHLEGGWWCWDTKSCADRWKNSNTLMTGKYWNPTKNYGGIFSTNQDYNPDFYNANSVFIPYCTSDSWSGDASKEENGEWHFRGKKVIKAVIEDLMKFGLSDAKEVLLSGCSAGGQGVIVNTDYVSEMLPKGLIRYKSLADAGWMMNMIPIRKDVISIKDQFISGYKYWKGVTNNNCEISNPGNEWMCYISPYAYPHIKSPIIIQTEQYDSFQLPYDCCSPPYNNNTDQSLLNYIHTIRSAFSTSLQEVKPPSSVYSPACYTHCLSEGSYFYTVNINGYSLSNVLGNWFLDKTNGPTFLIDNCAGFNCSNNCPPFTSLSSYNSIQYKKNFYGNPFIV